MSKEVNFVGVDVGSGSVRAALVDQTGHVLRTSVKELQTWKPKVDFYEQSSNDVWDCCVYVIKVTKGLIAYIVNGEAIYWAVRMWIEFFK